MDGHRPPKRRRINWNLIRTNIQRLINEWNGQPGDTLADASATALVTRLDEALLAYQRRQVQGDDFMRANRKNDHIEDLRRLITELLDVLSDWESCSDRHS